jgi:[ribosomal protein S5]-alanine N-acetyltransferase
MTDGLDPEVAGAPEVRIETERLIVRPASLEDVPAIIDYYTRNREHLRPWDPERPQFFYEARFWRRQIRQNIEDLLADRALRLFVFPAVEAERVIGNIGFSNIVRGIAQNCTLGYSIGAEEEGQGLMYEALRATIPVVFRELNLRRIEANYVPHNRRSGELLRRLGFQVEGYSRDYLRIAGEWEDHIRTALTNPHWVHRTA